MTDTAKDTPSADYLEAVEGTEPTAYRELFDYDGGCTFRCGMCGRDVSARSCPEHAPTEFPGLRRVECDTGEHELWAHDRDDYGHGCPWCWWNRAQEHVAELTRCKHPAEPTEAGDQA